MWGNAFLLFTFSRAASRPLWNRADRVLNLNGISICSKKWGFVVIPVGIIRARNTFMGREFVEKFSQQDVKVQNIVPAALANQVVSGEVPLSPTIFDSNIVTAKRKGAPVDWRPLEPVLTNVGSSAMTTRSPHPHAAILFLDYLHSKEGQQVVMRAD
jgi:hypothetical protein